MNVSAEVYTIQHDATLQAVVMHWEGYATSAQFREGTELMLNLLIQHKATRVLADIKNMVIIGQEDQQWLNTHFIPRAIRFGFRHMAILRPKHYFNQVAVETVSYKVDKNKLSIHFFDAREEAENWLRNLPQD